MLIAVDFDGTIVEHRYPEIGKEIPFAISTLKRLQEEGHRLVLWTVREGALLNETVEFCRQRGLEFYAVNANFPEEVANPGMTACRKLKADLFIDDRNVGYLPDWGVIYELVHRRCSYRRYMHELHQMEEPDEKLSFFQRLFGRHK